MVQGGEVKSVPAGAWDTHHHIFEPDKFPLSPGRHYTPATATLEELKAFEKSIGVENVCVAHGFSFGSDCTSLLHYLQELKGHARGICVLNIETVTDETLSLYHEAGVRSVRLDYFRSQAIDDPDKQVELIQSTAKRLVRWGKHTWSIQIQQPNLGFWRVLTPLATQLPVPLVVGHMALIQTPSMSASADEPLPEPQSVEGFDDLLEALRRGNTWIKISAPYRCSNICHTWDDLEGPIKALVAANKDRILWGSDWPRTQRHQDRVGKPSDSVEHFLEIQDAQWIRSLSRWLSEDEWYRMWVTNPLCLYS